MPQLAIPGRFSKVIDSAQAHNTMNRTGPCTRGRQGSSFSTSQGVAAAAPDEEEDEDAAANIYGFALRNKRMTPKLMELGILRLEEVLKVNPTLGTIAEQAALATLLEEDIDSTMQYYSHLFTQEKCLQMITEHGTSRNRSGVDRPGPENVSAPVVGKKRKGPPPKPTGRRAVIKLTSSQNARSAKPPNL